MTRLMLIINPAAGRGGFRNGLGDALNLLDKGGCRTTLFFTSGRGDATEFAAKYGADFDIVGCVGGDGTLSEVLAGLMRLENPPKVGYIPMARQTTSPRRSACRRTIPSAPRGAFSTASRTHSTLAALITTSTSRT